MADITGGVPKQMGGYDYSAKANAAAANKGADVTVEKPDQTGGYDYSAKSNAARMYRMTGNKPASTAPVNYGTELNVKLKKARVNRALGSK